MASLVLLLFVLFVKTVAASLISLWIWESIRQHEIEVHFEESWGSPPGRKSPRKKIGKGKMRRRDRKRASLED